MSHTTANFLAIDLGASAGRVLLGRWDGVRFELEEIHRFTNEPVSALGRLHWDVLRLWHEIKSGIARYTARYDAPLAGIGLDTWGVDFALLDRAGRLLSNPYHYRDSRTNGMLERAFARVPRQKIYEQTGLQFMQINTLYQLFSMVEERDPQLEAAATFLMMPDLFNYWLTGRKVVEYTNATTTQFFHCRERRWATELLDALGLPVHLLPPVVPPGTVLDSLRRDVMEEVGLRRAAPVIAPATHDTGSAVAAVPGLDQQSAYISSGTWSLMGMEVPQPVLNEEALAGNWTNEGGVAGTIRFLKNIAGLWLLQECRRRWERDGAIYTWEALLAQAEQAPPFVSLVDPDAPDFLGPSDMPAAIRAWCRATGQPEPGDVGALVRCCLESLALKYRVVLESLERVTGRTIEALRVVGGGSQNRLLCQWTADACGCPVVAGPVEATAFGNILVQAITTGHLPDLAAGRQAIAASVRLDAYQPRERDAWDAALARFKLLIGV